jgi:hypothetical protein
VQQSDDQTPRHLLQLRATNALTSFVDTIEASQLKEILTNA